MFVVAGEDAEVAGDASFDGGLLDAVGGGARDVLVVVCLVADDGAEADDGVVTAGAGGVEGGDGKLEGAGEVEDLVRADVVLLSGLFGAVEEARGDVLVEAGDEDGEGDGGAVEGPRVGHGA